MKPTETPGPWVQYNSNPKLVLKLRPDGRFNLLAECQNEGDARLIAAAPTLLAALQSVVQADEASGGFLLTAELEAAARAAIASACNE
jgi:hypothetical protein